MTWGRPLRVPASRLPAAAFLVAAFLVASCGGGSSSPTPGGAAGPTPSARAPVPTPLPSESPGLTRVRLLLRWTLGAEFAGYVAGIDQGFYEAAGIDLTIVEGGPDIFPEVVGSQTSGPEFTISWVPRVLQAREAGSSDLVDIAQMFRRSATLSISFRDKAITRPADLKGQRVGVLGAGNEFEVTAAAKAAGLDIEQDLTLVEQDTGMRSFLRGGIDVAQATIYDGYAQVLEATDPANHLPYQPTDLNVINYNDEGTAMLQDAVFARASWLGQDGNEELAARFLKASFQGWMFCRDHPADCVDAVVAAGVTEVPPDASSSPIASAATGSPVTSAAAPGDNPVASKLRSGHEAWAMNEVNPLIWPAPDGIGVLDAAEWQRTVDVCLAAGVIATAPSGDAFRTDLTQAALATLDELDTTGAAFVKGTVEITPVEN
jgi:NitT/TauT family transport system substrate-binding protein